MASPIAIEFIEQALSPHTPFPLSYSDPHQKWLIRTHLTSLLSDHPSFSPSFGTFVHDDGAASHLLCLSGHLRTSHSPIHLTLWLHQNHPLMAPLAYISDPNHLIRRSHPFVDALSGRVSCPSLLTWSHPSSSSLSDLLRNLSRLFSRDHPFSAAPSVPSASCCHPSLVSKREALDRLAGSLHYDIAALAAAAEADAAALCALRDDLAGRGRAGALALAALGEERRALRKAAAGLAERADVAVNWLKVNDGEKIEAAIGGDKAEMAFEAEEEEEEVVEWVAAESGVEDVMYALDRAVEEGLVSFEVYIKQVRVLAREQFGLVFKIVKLRGYGNIL